MVKSKNRLLLITILLIAFFLRIYSISGNDIFFFFDQSRDANVVKQIIDQRDLKIMGPSVSGTDDSVYHGVLYYYVIAPAYFLGNGSPFVVAIYLSFISLISIFVVYKIGSEIFKSETVGLIAAFLHSVSVISIQQGTWLSNPTFSGIFVPLTYYLMWKIFLSGKKESLKTYILLGITIALSMQSALQNITIFGSLFLILLFSLKTEIYEFSFKKAVSSAIAFIFGISSMIITELLMYKRGILSFTSLHLSQHETSITSVIPKIAAKYFSVVTTIINPSMLTLLLFAFIIYFAKLNKKQVVWSFAFFTAPIWLLFWHYRDPNHTFIGIEVILFLLIATGLANLLKQKNIFGRSFAILFVVIFTFLNISTLSNWKKEQFNYFGIQKGAFLSNQLNTIDKTYELADGAHFSFSSLTSPYLINTTWNYLYQWYGQQKYGYVPSYLGIDQAYFVGTEALPEKSNPEKIHFAIIEPDTTLSDEIQDKFLIEQNGFFDKNISKESYKFGSIILMSFVE